MNHFRDRLRESSSSNCVSVYSETTICHGTVQSVLKTCTISPCVLTETVRAKPIKIVVSLQILNKVALVFV